MNKIFAVTATIIINAGLCLFLYANFLPGSSLQTKFVCMQIPIIALISYSVGVLTEYCLSSVRETVKNSALNSYKNEYEKNSVATEAKNDRIEALENKIKTLEVALKRALNK